MVLRHINTQTQYAWTLHVVTKIKKPSLQFAAERSVLVAAIFDRSLSDIRALSHRHLVTDCALSTLFNVSRGQYSGQYSVSILPFVLAFHTIQRSAICANILSIFFYSFCGLQQIVGTGLIIRYSNNYY